MANNRMWLVHRPTGRAFPIGKRMGFGWYRRHSDVDGPLNKFFDACANDERVHGGNQDDWQLVLEDNDGAPKCGRVERYDDNNIPIIEE